MAWKLDFIVNIVESIILIHWLNSTDIVSELMPFKHQVFGVLVVLQSIFFQVLQISSQVAILALFGEDINACLEFRLWHDAFDIFINIHLLLVLI